MSLKSEIVSILLQAFMLGLFIQIGWIGASQDFFSNVLTAVVVMVICRFIGQFFR